MTEQLTKSGYPVIPPGLVGQKVDYKVLKEPARPEYPGVDEVRYSDAYTRKLNEIYSLDDILGESREDLEELDQVEKLIDLFPFEEELEGASGLGIVGLLLNNSAIAGLWQPFIIDVSYLPDSYLRCLNPKKPIRSAEEYIESVEALRAQYGRGVAERRLVQQGVIITDIVHYELSDVKERGLGLLTVHDTKVIALPSQKLVEYFAGEK